MNKILNVPICYEVQCLRYGLYCSEDEAQVLDYQTQQYKLLPLLAAAYAYWFSGLKMRDTYFLLNDQIQQGNTEFLPEVITSFSWTNS